MEKSQNIAATVRKHHEWILKLGVSAFNGQSTERSKAILTKCAPVKCHKKASREKKNVRLTASVVQILHRIMRRHFGKNMGGFRS